MSHRPPSPTRGRTIGLCLETALSLAELLRAARTVVAGHQALIDDVRRTDPAPDGAAVLADSLALPVVGGSSLPGTIGDGSRRGRILAVGRRHEERFMDENWTRGDRHVEMVTLDGRDAFRVMVPEYHGAGCLACHGGPAGATDITGYPKEGAELGEPVECLRADRVDGSIVSRGRCSGNAIEQYGGLAPGPSLSRVRARRRSPAGPGGPTTCPHGAAPRPHPRRASVRGGAGGAA